MKKIIIKNSEFVVFHQGCLQPLDLFVPPQVLPLSLPPAEVPFVPPVLVDLSSVATAAAGRARRRGTRR